jgi:hypothetical protein
MQHNYVSIAAHTWPIILMVCLLGDADDHPYDGDPIQIQGRHGAMYLRGDGREVIECSVGSPPEICGALEVTGLSHQIYLDCSDEQFECLFNLYGVPAIPRAGLTLGQKYTAYGANLSVERCFGDQDSCEIAMIKSECHAERPVTIMFYFSSELGITTFYPTGGPPRGVDAKMLTDAIPLMTYVLVAEKGFLRVPLSLRRVAPGTRCNHG